jgi:TPR repeat protein
MREDKVQAADFYQKACNRGIARGCYKLGAMYKNGDGVPQDKTKALELYDKACNLKLEQGCKKHAGRWYYADGAMLD